LAPGNELVTETDSTEHHDQLDQSLRECQSLLAQLRASIPATVDGPTISPTAKVPYKAVLLSVGLSYRIAELSDATLASLADRYRVAAAVTARAAMETAAVHFYCVKKIRESIVTGSSVDADAVLFKALTGTKVFEGSDAPIQVLTAISRTDKLFSHFADFYNHLSEFAHPNWFGTHHAYVKDGETEFHADFDPDLAPGISSGEVTRPLAVALMVFGHSRAVLAAELTAFTAMCEREVADLGA
jgi:hypothetical protein